MKDENPAALAVTGNFQLNATMPNGKQFSISGYIFDKESVDSLNDRVDKLHDVLDRQRTRAEIPELEAKRDQMARALGNMRDVLLGLKAKQDTGAKLTSQEKLTLQNMEVSIKKQAESIEEGTAAIAEARQKVGLAA